MPPDAVGAWGGRTARCAPVQNPVSFWGSGAIGWTVNFYCISYSWNPYVGWRRIITVSYWNIRISPRVAVESLPFERQIALLQKILSFSLFGNALRLSISPMQLEKRLPYFAFVCRFFRMHISSELRKKVRSWERYQEKRTVAIQMAAREYHIPKSILSV